MKRLLSTTAWDIRLQFRNGFYYVSAFVAVAFIVSLKQVSGVDWQSLWPVIILENLVVNAFYFIAGLVLLEKGEGTLEAQVVTPLRTREYLAAKVLSLGFLSVLETLLVVVAVTGAAFNWTLIVLGILLLTAFYGLYGFIVVARYDSITDFILPSAVWVIWFSLPILYFFDIWQSWIMFLHPLQAPLILLQAAFEPLSAGYIVYGISYSLLWIFIVYRLANRVFYRFVTTGEGTRRRVMA